MKLSVIVTIYNREAVLRRCVDSILAQNMTDYEVILVDDGSRDGSRQRARYRNPEHRLRYRDARYHASPERRRSCSASAPRSCPHRMRTGSHSRSTGRCRSSSYRRALPAVVRDRHRRIRSRRGRAPCRVYSRDSGMNSSRSRHSKRRPCDRERQVCGPCGLWRRRCRGESAVGWSWSRRSVPARNGCHRPGSPSG